jgi:archaellum component FlaC
MQTMAQGTTDERLDRLEERVEEGFRAVDKEFEEVDTRFDGIDKRLDLVDVRLEGIGGQLAQMDKRIDQVVEGVALIQKTLLFGSVSLLSVVFAAFVALLTQG